MNSPIETYTLVVKKSDIYPASHFRCGLLFTGLASTVVYFLPFSMEDPITIFYIQAGAFLLGYLFAYSKKWKRFFTTKREMKEEVYQKALESFYDYNLNTKGRTVLLFASELERRIEAITSYDLSQEESHIISDRLNEVIHRVRKEKPAKILQELASQLSRNESREALPQTQETTEESSQASPEDHRINQPESHQTDGV